MDLLLKNSPFMDFCSYELKALSFLKAKEVIKYHLLFNTVYTRLVSYQNLS